MFNQSLFSFEYQNVNILFLAEPWPRLLSLRGSVFCVESTSRGCAMQPADVGDLRGRVPGLLPGAAGGSGERGRTLARAAQHRGQQLQDDRSDA